MAETSTQDLILDELRSLRSEFTTYARDTAERVTALETDMHGLVGNGQPGRIKHLESRIDKLSQWKWWVVGCAAGSGGVISALAWVVTEMKR